MLSKVKAEPFDDQNWVYEIKYDGYRAISSIQDSNVELTSRNNISFNVVFKDIVEELQTLEHDAVMDGEVVIENKKGISDFQALQNYQKTAKGFLKYYVFDLLSLDGEDIRHLTLLERKQLLEQLLGQYSFKHIFYSKHIEKKGLKFFELAKKRRLEGIMAKNAESTYQSGRRSADWLKIKVNARQEAIIIGITEPQGSRIHFGSLVLGIYENNKLIYAGNCGTGFTEKTLNDLYLKFKPFFVSKPLVSKNNSFKNVQWIKPKFICEVKFTEWTKEGSMRHPVFMGLRNDKKVNEVIREKEEQRMQTENKNSGKKNKVPEIKSRNISAKKNASNNNQFTNLEKIYWPREKISKGDLIDYYEKIAPYILPYIKNRPQSMNRFPNGINGASFYQKDVDPEKIPSWVKSYPVYSSSNKEEINYLICNDKKTLMYMANLGCIEINPWNSQIKNLENPDWMVIDLDPEAISFSKVVETANEVHAVLNEMEIESYCKTSGATGLHIYIPLKAKYEYSIVRNFGQMIAKLVHDRIPKFTSITRSPKDRQKKVYLDYLQNSKGQTLAAPYSVRPKPGATVSTPLNWNEVNSKLNPADFTIKTIFKRLDKVGDLWSPVIGKGADLKKAIHKIESI